MQIPVLLPEKLSALKCLVEVEDGTSTDLAGDAGAVGRFAMTRHSEQQQAQLDLKGALGSDHSCLTLCSKPSIGRFCRLLLSRGWNCAI